jgi:hypothetical protein
MKRTLLLLLVIVGSRLDAHHRVSEVYEEKRAVTIVGRVTEWIYREPHCFVILEARGARDQVERWIAEGPGAAEWRRRGVTPTILRLGDQVTVTGHPGRIPAERRLFAKEIVRAEDGWRWRVGAR